MKESVKLELSKMKPSAAEGKVTLQLINPDTRKVVEEIKGKNHVYVEVLQLARDFRSMVSDAYMTLNDSSIAVDTSLPYVFGNMVGYGVPSLAASGLYRGAYDSGSQVLAQHTYSPNHKCHWLFKYEWLTTQANGTIRNIGITQQNHSTGYLPGFDYPYAYNNVPSVAMGTGATDKDAIIRCWCNSSGVVYRYNQYDGSQDTIDVSAVGGATPIGSTAADKKTVGYNPTTGHWFIFRGSSTSGNRRMYEFTDNTFTSFVQSFACSNMTNNTETVFYVHDAANVAHFFPASYNPQTMIPFNFVTNTLSATVNLTDSTWGVVSSSSYFHFGTIPLSDTLIIGGMFTGSTNSPTNGSKIVDLSTDTVLAYCHTPVTYYDSSNYPYKTLLKGDSLTVKLPINPYHRKFHNAISAYDLASPIVKTSSYGMICTYELDVFW